MKKGVAVAPREIELLLKLYPIAGKGNIWKWLPPLF
jgi:hypothetical protein